MTRTSLSLLTFILLLAAAPVPVQSQRPATPKNTETQSGSISGRVVNESGQPLSEAFVNAEAVGVRGGTRHPPTITDRNGMFRIDSLEGGSYYVTASIGAYTPKPHEPANTPAPQYKPGDSVTLIMIKGGVITGTVTGPNGDPVVAIPIAAKMIRDHTGRRMPGATVREDVTDDRGVYRIYGLATGIYIVGTDSTNDYSQSGVNAFANDIPTYAPSATRDTAAEINVRAGEEVSNVDIRYRAERGRSITGTVAEIAGEESGFAMVLSSTAPGGQEWHTYANPPGNRTFGFDGIPDGDYYVTAISYLREGERGLSDSKLINVRGADITGLEFTPHPTANVRGRVVAEETKAPECTEKTPLEFTGTSVSAWHKAETVKGRPPFVWSMGAPATPDEKGNFTIRSLAPSQYYFQARVPAKDWYLKSIKFDAPRATDGTRQWTNIKWGDRLTGLTVTFVQGAASLSGKLVLAEGQTQPDKLFVYLAPVELERAEEPLSFYGAPVTPDGKVALNNLAPGRYWVLPQVVVEETLSPLAKIRLPDSTRLRATLRREAEAGKTEIELKPCQHVVNLAVTMK